MSIRVRVWAPWNSRDSSAWLSPLIGCPAKAATSSEYHPAASFGPSRGIAAQPVAQTSSTPPDPVG